MRKIIEVNKFEFQGKKYYNTIFSDGISIFVRVFLNNKPANGYIYQANIMILHFDRDAIEEITPLAKQDIIEQRYEEYLEAIKNAL